MAYFLKKTHNKGRTYLSIVESYYSPQKRCGAHRTYKSLASVESQIAKGIDDPIAHFQKEVDALNDEVSNDKVLKISDSSPELYLGYFPFVSLLNKMNIKNISIISIFLILLNLIYTNYFLLLSMLVLSILVVNTKLFMKLFLNLKILLIFLITNSLTVLNSLVMIIILQSDHKNRWKIMPSQKAHFPPVY